MAPDVEQHLSQLLREAQAGNGVAYRHFLQETRELVWRLLRSRLRSSAALEDVVQETLLSIHRARHTYDPSRPIGPWIRAIALNRLRDSGRVRQRRRDRLSADLDWQQAALADRGADTAGPTFLRAALALLSEAQREVIWLLKFEGYSVTEIAGQTGRSPASVKVTAHRGYRRLRERWRAR